MAKHKGDIEIGRRMALECYRIFGAAKNAAQQLQCHKNSVYEWEQGKVPGASLLAKLHSCGGDVLYVLTGKREKIDG